MIPNGRTRTCPAVLALATACVLWAPTAAIAQPAISASIGRALSSMDEPAIGVERRQTTAGSVEAEHVAAGGRLRLFYEFDGGTFATEGDWRYLENIAGATVRLPFGGEKPKHAVYLTANGIWRDNGSSWSAVDYRGVRVMANVELRPRDTATYRFGYRLDGRNFPDLPALDQVQHDGFVSLLFNLPSRTTLVGEAHVGAKSYAATVDTNWAVVEAGGTMAPRGMGRGVGPGLRGTWMGSAAASTVTENNAGMVVVFGRVAQSLSDRTGAWLQYSQRATFGRVPPVVVTTPALFFDDGVYDDPFASDARVVTAALKHEFASGVTLDVDVARMLKDYTAALALDLAGTTFAGDPLRSDRVWRSSAGVSIPMFPGRSGPVAVNLDVTYAFTRHRSNDAFYNYTSHGVATGFSFSY